MEPADLTAIVTRVLARMETQFAQGHFVVKTDIASSLPRVLADEGATEQAIENLLANAIKYSGDAKQIDVQARRAGDPRRGQRDRPWHWHLARKARIFAVLPGPARTRRRPTGHRTLAWRSSITPCAGTAASCASAASRSTAAPLPCTSPYPARTRTSQPSWRMSPMKPGAIR